MKGQSNPVIAGSPRKRNSSLVESACAEDVTGLKSDTEAADLHEGASGRGAFCKPEKAS